MPWRTYERLYRRRMTRRFAHIVAPPPSGDWIAYPVNRRVNSPKNDDPKLIEPEPT